ncbi:MAG: hypothetical protein JWO32_1699 [Bacteroidetes bacterium]|nr:hypothetical protein [Bacteroidota bacterium]
MRIKTSAGFLFIIISSAVLGLGIYSGFKTEKSEILFGKGENYASLWKRVDSCEKKGLSESALKIIEAIYKKAKTDNNAPQFVKSVLYRMKFEGYKEEFSLEKSIIKLRDEAATANYPVKPVLQSILADAYWQYYNNNRWKFYNRTSTVGFKNDDLTTWDLKTITYAVISNYKASLDNTDSLKRTRIDIYEDILEKGTEEGRKWRPTLYDFIAHRALNFFKSTEPDVARPAQRFSVNDDVYLLPYPDFLNKVITNPSDSLEIKYYALKLFQDLTRFHENDENKDALLDVELLRLDYINANSQNPKKDTLFLTTLQHLQNKFSKTARVTEIDYRIANWYFGKAALYKPLEGDSYKWYKKTAVEICNSAITKFPNSFGAKQCLNLITTIKAKQVNLTIEEVNTAEKPFRALVTSCNINKLYFKVVKTSHLEMRRFGRLDWGQKLYEKLNTLPVVKTFEQDIINDEDYQAHREEIKIPELPYGYYVVLTSINPDFKYSNNLTSYAQCIISDITTIERAKEDGSHDFYALNRETGEPIKNTNVQVWHEKYSYVTRDYEVKKGLSLKTDDKGWFKVADIKDEDRTFFVEVLNGKDSYFNNNSYYSYKQYEDNNTYVKSFLFTDRAIYRPGQIIYFKSIVLEGKNNDNYKIKPNFPVTVTFYDVNQQKVGSQDLTTNEFGTVNGSFTAPQGILNGQMYLYDGHGSVYFSIEDYKRPKFETKFNDVKGSYKINDSITVTGVAKAYAGNVIDGAKVNYRVVRKVNYPYWWWWYRSYYSTGTESTEMISGETLSNDTGGYVIKFKALPDESVSKESQATFMYEITADVTDINGESHSTSTQATVGYQSINLNVSTDAIINQKEIKPIKINSPNLNGVPEPTKGNVAIYKLKQPDRAFRNRLWVQPDRHSLSKDEYYKNFPYDLYDDEQNKYKWEKDSKLLDKPFDTGIKTEYDLSTELKNFKPGVYMVEVKCKDKFGQEVKAFDYFTLFNPGNTELPEHTPDWFYVTKNKAEPGDKVSYIFASGFPNTNYLFELEHKGKAIETKTIAASMSLNEIVIEEKHRGNLAFHATFVKHNRFYHQSNIITVPYTNKELDIQFETFRNKLLPGQQEEWKLVIKDKKGDKMSAELMTAMYDASLDAFRPNYWPFNIYNNWYARLNWTTTAGGSANSYEFNDLKSEYSYLPSRYYDALNYFGLYFSANYHYRGGRAGGVSKGDYNPDPSSPPAETAAYYDETTVTKNAVSGKGVTLEEKSKDKKSAETEMDGDVMQAGVKKESSGENRREGKESGGELGNVKARSNFNETAFFYPSLQTNEKGETVIKFTIPESLTKWKVMGLAHTKDLKIGQFQKDVVTQKDLMVQPNAPRFFREGDHMTFISKIANLSDKDMTGTSELKLYDALTDKEISASMIEALSGKFPTVGFREFNAKKGQSTSIEWNITIPAGYSAIKYKIVAKAGNFSDGEEMVIPVLTNRMLVTESMPLPIRGNQTKEFSFGKFINQNNNSTTLKNHAYTLEFTANPAWYAVQALPYLMEYPYECAEQTFARYYANSLATHVANSKPKIKAVFEGWKTAGADAFLSNLEKNQELKSLILEETPWVLESKNETENKKRLGLLFDLNRMANEQGRAFRKLQKSQTSNGGFWWFEGGPDDWYITQHIACGFGHLDKLGVLKVRQDAEAWNLLNKAVRYCDNRMREEYELTKKYDKDYKIKNHLSSMAVQYLYMRSFFKDVDLETRNKEHFEYYKKQEQTYWLTEGRFMQGMIALNLFRFSDLKTPKDILKSLKENSINSEEMGMYWKENYGYYWYEAPIEQQAIMIEAFDEINNDIKAVDDLKTWLIKSKQTQNWGTTRATTEAVYALLLKGTDWLSTEPNVEITIGDIKLDPKNDADIKVEPGTGYFKKAWAGSDIKPSLGKIKIQKKDAGVSWGAVYWQYFEQLDKITPHETPLKLKKQLFLQKNTSSGPVIELITAATKLKLGDKVKVRIELRVDRDMDYVHMKDMRAAGFEPTNVFSGYKWQDGLGYYESTKDAATNFFFSKLTKGTYVFEYPVVVNHYGDFSNGITQIQCMYAPEYTSHSEGIRVKIIK